MKQLTMAALRRLSSAACETDARVVIDLDGGSYFEIRAHNGTIHTVRVSGLREMRLIAKQISQLADYMQDQAQLIEDAP